jgi:hypothetical protein
MRFLWQGLLLFSWILQSPELVARDSGLSLPLSPRLRDPQPQLVGVDLYYKPTPVFEGRPGSLEVDSERKDRRRIDETFSSNRASLHDDASIVRGGSSGALVRDMSSDSDDVESSLIGVARRLVPSDSLVEVVLDERKASTDASFAAFMEKIDTLVNGKYPPHLATRRRNGAMVGALFGAIPIVPATGVLRYTTRDLLGLPKSTALGNVAVVVTAVSLLLPAMGQFAEGGRGLTTSSKCCFSPPEAFLRAEEEYMFPTSDAHRFLKGVMGVAVFVNSLTRLVQMAEIQKVPEFIVGTGPFYCGSDFEMNFSNGERELDAFMYKNVYSTNPLTKIRKELIKIRIRLMKRAIAMCTDEGVIEQRHKLLIEGSEADARRKPWQASWLLVKRLEAIRGGDNPDARWTNFASDMDFFGRTSSRKKTADGVAKAFIILGTWGRFEIVSYGTSLALVWLGLDPWTASWISGGAAGFATGGMALWESNLHHTFMRNIFRCAEEDTSPDNTATQVATTAPPAVAAAMFSISGVAMGLKACASYPVFAQGVLLVTSGVLNFSSYFASMKRRTVSLVRPLIARFRSPTDQRKADIMAQCDRLEGVVDRLTDSTTDTLQHLLMYGGGAL